MWAQDVTSILNRKQLVSYKKSSDDGKKSNSSVVFFLFAASERDSIDRKGPEVVKATFVPTGSGESRCVHSATSCIEPAFTRIVRALACVTAQPCSCFCDFSSSSCFALSRDGEAG